MGVVTFVLALSVAGFWWKAGEEETGSGYLWAGLSLVASALVMFVFGGGLWMLLFAQLGLMAGITMYRVWRDPD